MWCRRIVYSLVAMSALWGAASADTAQESTGNKNNLPPAEVLLRRLEEAEARIRALEAQMNGTGSPVALPPGEQSQAGSGLGQPTAEKKPEQATLADRFKTMEGELKKLRDAEAKRAEVKYPNVKIGGRIHFDTVLFPTHDRGINFFENPSTGADPENSVYFRRLRLTFRGDISPTIDYKLDFEFADPNNAQFRDAYVRFHELPYVREFWVGNFKRPMSLDQLNSSNTNVFLERPLPADAEDEEARRPGIMFHGYNDDLTYNWSIGLFSQENIQNDGNYRGDPFQPTFNTRLSLCPWYDDSSDGRGYLHLAVSNEMAWPEYEIPNGAPFANEARFRGRPELRTVSRWLDTGHIARADFYDILGLEAMLNVGPFQVVGEWMPSWVSRDRDDGLFFQGGYVYVAYFLTGEHQKYDRQEGTLGRPVMPENFFLVNQCCGIPGGGWGAWQVAARYSWLDLSDDDVLGGQAENVTLGLNWWFTPNARLMMNYVVGRIQDHKAVQGFTEGDFTGFQVRMHVDW